MLFETLKDRVLSSGAFDKVCLGLVSNEQIRDETKINSDQSEADNDLKSSIERNNKDKKKKNQDDEFKKLIPPSESSRLVAVKIKGKSLRSNIL